MRRVDLANAQWTVEVSGDATLAPAHVHSKAFPARVPGCVHSDLVRAGVIGHPDIAFNEESIQWIGRTDWRYRCTFTVEALTLAEEHVDLVLDGLDTVAVIEVNDRHIGEAMNMHHAHRYSIKPMLRFGENELVVTLRGPVSYVEQQSQRLGTRPVNGEWTPYCHIRKLASNFQWDWGPKVATCGIWRGASLEAWSTVRVAGVRPIVTMASSELAVVRVEVDLVGDDASTAADARLHHGGESIAATLRRQSSGQFSGELRIAHPHRWWPRGWGGQPLHGLAISVVKDGPVLDERNCRIGLRTAALRRPQDIDSHGSGFAIAVNGMPMFCNGANWIPEGLFPEDQSPSRIRERVQQAADANMNMLRVWGGGTYEQTAFYEACDELGIMVWQDFMFACATYPEDDSFPQLIEREARETVSRLAHHSSIVLWCGGNENVLGYESWGWKQRMPPDQKWGERYYFDVLPQVVREVDPSRPYWPDSPHSDAMRTARHPNDPDHGDRHTWDAKVEGYRAIVPRFCSEFGHQSPPCWATMREAWGVDQLRVDSQAMRHRQRAGAEGGDNDVWYGSSVMAGRWRDPRDFDEWLYQAHLLQARAISIGIEWMRANQPRCMGALFWQLNDAWAGHSWSCIDSAGRLKPLWFAVRRSFTPRLLTFQPFNGELRLCAINEAGHEWNADVLLRRLNMDGMTLAEAQVTLGAGSGAAARTEAIEQLIGLPADRSREFLIAETDGAERAWWFFAQDRDLALPVPRIEATGSCANGTTNLTLHAGVLMKDVTLAVDRLAPDAVIDDNLFTLLPGESRTLMIRTRADVPPASWVASPVMMCANMFTQMSDRGC